MQLLRFFLFPFSILFGIVTELRNFFYSVKILRPSRFDIPVISIGNLSVGGTGKTPHTDYIVSLLKKNYKVATLSRGYRRKTKGFAEVKPGANAGDTGDEPLLLKQRHPDCPVNVDSNRVKGIIKIVANHPDTDVIVLDDAYQHRAVQAGFSVLLTDATHPFFTDFILPVGNLREMRKNASRCDAVVVTKSEDLEEEMKNFYKLSVARYTQSPLFFSSYSYGPIAPVFPDTNITWSAENGILLVTGIARARPLKNHLSKKTKKLHHLAFGDHHRFTAKDIEKIEKLFHSFVPDGVIVTTEKDAVRLATLPAELKSKVEKLPLFYQPVDVVFDHPQKFNELIETYVGKATADYRIHQG